MSSDQDTKLGRFCWIEANQVDSQAGKGFYSSLFSWELQDFPMGEGGVYTVFKKGGKVVAGLFQLTPELLEAKVPAHWISYISVPDIEEGSRRVLELGGKVVKAPFDIQGSGKMAIIQDPAGAHFALWQSVQPMDPLLAGETNSYCWLELVVRDIDKAGAFYSQLFGWNCVVDHSMGRPYSLFSLDGRPFAGMMAIEESWGAVPPHWLIYFAVEDIEGMAAKIQNLGGKAITPIMEIAKVGRFVTVADPQGAVFAFIQPNASTGE
jgi:uncharacterized protein